MTLFFSRIGQIEAIYAVLRRIIPAVPVSEVLLVVEQFFNEGEIIPESDYFEVIRGLNFFIYDSHLYLNLYVFVVHVFYDNKIN